MCCGMDSLQSLAGPRHDQIHSMLFQSSAFPLMYLIVKDGIAIWSSYTIKHFLFNPALFITPFPPQPQTQLFPVHTCMMWILAGGYQHAGLCTLLLGMALIASFIFGIMLLSPRGFATELSMRI